MDIDFRLNKYAKGFSSSFIKECQRCEGSLLFARDYICNNRMDKEAVASYFFGNEQYFYRISLLDNNGVNIFSFVVNPDQTYLNPKPFEEFRNLPPIDLKNVRPSDDNVIIPVTLQPIPGGIAQRALVALKNMSFLLADINISNVFANAMKASNFSSGTFLLVLDYNNFVLFSSLGEITDEDVMRLKDYSLPGDYKFANSIYRSCVFTMDTLSSFCKDLKNIKFIIGIDYGHMLMAINKGLSRGLTLTTIFAILIFVAFTLAGLYIKHKTDIILKRTDEIATGEFDKKISIRFPLEFRWIAQNINELSIKLKNLTSDKVKSARLSAIGRFAAHMVHDLRNPVYGLSLIAYALKKKIKKDDPKLRYFDEIVAGIKKLGEIIDKIAEHGKIYEPQKEQVDLNRLIKETADSYSKEYPCKIITQFGDIGMIQIDPNQWRRVFLNLFQNSYEAKKEDCQIMIKTYHSNIHPRPSVVIEIADTSGGIASEIIDNIFEPFSSTKKKGLGLGLSYIREIVKVHNGEIKVENSPGIGVKFIFTLVV